MQMFINGQWLEGSASDRIPVLNPATEELIDTVPVATDAELDMAVEAAQEAFKTWRKVAVHDRSEMLRYAAEKLRNNAEAYARLVTEEQGKTLAENRESEIQVSYETLDYYAQLIKDNAGRVLPARNPSTFNFVSKEPYGPTACIVPFNYPVLLLIWKLAPAVAAGNTVVVKPSEKTPLSTLKLMEDVLDHFPPGVINVVAGYSATAKALCRHPDIRTIAFTGSTAVGQSIVKETAHQSKNLLLELGGKDAAVVSQTSDLNLAARAISSSSLWNSGQICTSTERVFVHASVYEEFLALLKERFEAIRLGDGMDESNDVGPLCDASGFEKIERHVEDAVAKGARLITGGARSKAHSKGYFFEPTILADTTLEMLCQTEESFGPMVSIAAYEDFEDVIHRVNESEYGLGAVLFSENPREVKAFFEDVKAGSIWINEPLTDSIGGPFGGMKSSGFGDYRELGQEGLSAFQETKHVHWTFAPEALQDDWF